MATPIPTYNWQYPALAQQHDWDCSQESCCWMLWAYGRTPSESWMEQSMIDQGIVSPDLGCLDASGAGLAAWLNTEYGGPEYGYLASNEPSVSFDQIAAEAATHEHPLAIGGRAWYHWSGVRGYDPAGDVLQLANPANGYQGVYQTLTRGQWASLGPFSMVRLTHPAAEGQVPAPEPSPPDLSDWFGQVGSGLLEMMAADGTEPAQEYSTWLPLGRYPADIEECVGQNGVQYRWLLATNRGYRYSPD